MVWVSVNSDTKHYYSTYISDGGKRFFDCSTLSIFQYSFAIVCQTSFHSNKIMITGNESSAEFRIFDLLPLFWSSHFFVSVYYLWYTLQSICYHVRSRSMLWSSETDIIVIIICLWCFYCVLFCCCCCCYYDLSRVLSFFLLAALLWLRNYEISSIYLNTYLHQPYNGYIIW